MGLDLISSRDDRLEEVISYLFSFRYLFLETFLPISKCNYNGNIGCS